MREGQHIDLVGAYAPAMREERRQSGVAGPYLRRHRQRRAQGGGRYRPATLGNGTIREDDVVADLFELARGQRTGRLAGDTTSITLFKAVGTALEDLAAAELALLL